MDVSSANRNSFNRSAVILGRSFLYSTKNKRPSIEPWGKTCFILPHSKSCNNIRSAIAYWYSL